MRLLAPRGILKGKSFDSGSVMPCVNAIEWRHPARPVSSSNTFAMFSLMKRLLRKGAPMRLRDPRGMMAALEAFFEETALMKKAAVGDHA